MKATPSRLLLAALLIAVVLALSWLGWQRRDGKRRSAEPSGPQTEETNSTSVAAVDGTMTPKSSPPLTVGAQERNFISAFNTPIAFYGRVIDQYGDPVPEADVKLSANDKAFGGRPSHYTRKTDTGGRFSIEGIAGITLGVEVSKPGYHSIPSAYGKVTSSGLFEYGLSSKGPYQSSKDVPTIFTLHKVGMLEPLVKVGKKNFRIARDGSPLSIAIDEQGAHQVIFRCWNQEMQRPANQRQYDWRLEITVPNGGLLRREDGFAFEAPQDGYVSSDTIEMLVSMGNQWRSLIERSYFINFNDGTSARANLEMHPGGDHFVVWESFFNPKPGSRNLESGAGTQAWAR
ncbi:MAG: hypothetical protein DME97_12180 [Verrucomicrobia bacterium]|nr:MAG: hypothetical protein DME97_12180 [Verrucomicrobiota bacterium]